MENKEMIEEMAQYLNGYLYPLDNNSIENCRILASALISQGWIKLSKDKVVLSIDEWINFNKDHANELIKTSEKEYGLGYIKGSKETAERYHNEIEILIKTCMCMHYISLEDGLALLNDNNNLAKQFGVEIKEN